MQRYEHIKFTNAQQAKSVHLYKNTKEENKIHFNKVHSLLFYKLQFNAWVWNILNLVAAFVVAGKFQQN